MYMMQIDPEKPGLFALLRGEGELFMRVLAWGFIIIVAPLLLAGTWVVWSNIL